MAVIRASFVLLLVAASTLLLLIAPASGAATTNEIKGIQAACNGTAFGFKTNDDVTSAGVLTPDDCVTCMTTIGHTAYDSSMYACSAVCQNPAYFPKTYGFDPKDCVTCIEAVGVVTPSDCQNCMAVHNYSTGAAPRKDCFACIKKDPTHGGNPAYMWACAQCARYGPNGDLANAVAYTQCMDCISISNATVKATEPPRWTDVGNCVYQANVTYNLETNTHLLNGTQYATCLNGPLSLVPNCTSCMRAAEGLFHFEAPVYPDLAKGYACADYCMNSNYTGGSADVARSCFACVEAKVPRDPWACSACMKTTHTDDCFTCVGGDPYGGNVSSYNWACSMCSKISDPTLMGLCMTCIKSQQGSAPGSQIDNTTEAAICSCIDLTQNRTLNVSRPLTAMERSCFSPVIQHNASGFETVLPIPWGNTTVDGNSSDCLVCMAEALTTSTTINKQYACNQYCQDPSLVSTSSAPVGNDASQCTPAPGYIAVYNIDHFGDDIHCQTYENTDMPSLTAVVAALCTANSACKAFNVFPIPVGEYDLPKYDGCIKNRTGIPVALNAPPGVCFYTHAPATSVQGSDCAGCVASKYVTDPWGCQACMISTSDTLQRRDCFDCVKMNPASKFDNHAWGCSQCATFLESSARTACYTCMSEDKINPCDCVEGIKNGTIVQNIKQL